MHVDSTKTDDRRKTVSDFIASSPAMLSHSLSFVGKYLKDCLFGLISVVDFYTDLAVVISWANDE